MEHIAIYDSWSGICTVHVKGACELSEHSDILKGFVADIFVEQGCKLFLFDMSQASPYGDSLAVFNAANPNGIYMDSLKKVRLAFVRKVMTNCDLFFEAVAINRGVSLRGFDSVSRAEWWLISGKWDR